MDAMQRDSAIEGLIGRYFAGAALPPNAAKAEPGPAKVTDGPIDRSDAAADPSTAGAQIPALDAQNYVQQRRHRALVALDRHLRDWAAGVRDVTTGSARRQTMQRAAKHARKLASLLNDVDLRTLAEVMGPLSIEAGHPASSTASEQPSTLSGGLAPLRLLELLGFLEDLNRASAALDALSLRDAAPRRGRPLTDDRGRYCVEALASIWLAFHPSRRITMSYKAGGFGAFIEEFNNELRHGFEPAQLQLLVRQYHEGQDRQAAGLELSSD